MEKQIEVKMLMKYTEDFTEKDIKDGLLTNKEAEERFKDFIVEMFNTPSITKDCLNVQIKLNEDI